MSLPPRGKAFLAPLDTCFKGAKGRGGDSTFCEGIPSSPAAPRNDAYHEGILTAAAPCALHRQNTPASGYFSSHRPPHCVPLCSPRSENKIIKPQHSQKRFACKAFLRKGAAESQDVVFGFAEYPCPPSCRDAESPVRCLTGKRTRTNPHSACSTATARQMGMPFAAKFASYSVTMFSCAYSLACRS